MKPIWRILLRIVRQVIGWGFIVLGILGLFLPILQGVLFLCIGVLLLAEDLPIFRRLIDKVESKWPRTRVPISKARGWLGHRQQPEPDRPADKERH
jgi:hypothetical protein